MPWHPTNCAVQRSIRGRSTDEVVKVTPARPGGIFRRRCIERLSVSTLKVADWSLVESIRQNWCKAPRPASTT